MVDELGNEADTYWEQDAVNDRDDWDQHLRAVEEKVRDRMADVCGDIAATRNLSLDETVDALKDHQ